MKTLSFVLSSVLVFACSAPSQTPNARAPLGGNPLVPLVPRTPAQGQVLAAAEGPAHVFTPRSHPAHGRALPTFVEPARLPKMRLGGCFAPEREPISYSAPPKRRVSSGSVGRRGFGQGGGLAGSSSGSASASPKPVPPPPAATPAPTAKAAAEAGDGYGYEYKNDPLNAGPMSGPTKDDARKREAPADAEIARHESPGSPRAYHDYGASIYLSNDDTMSLSSAQRVTVRDRSFLADPARAHSPARAAQLLLLRNCAAAGERRLQRARRARSQTWRAGHLHARPVGRRAGARARRHRRNAALTFVVDRSGSMSDEGRMDYLKRGLLRMTSELKRGDLVNLVVFDHEACSALENFVVGRDSNQVLSSTIQKLAPRGSTDVDSGLRLGYSLADKSYQPTHSNRVVADHGRAGQHRGHGPEVISLISAHYDKRQDPPERRRRGHGVQRRAARSTDRARQGRLRLPGLAERSGRRVRRTLRLADRDHGE